MTRSLAALALCAAALLAPACSSPPPPRPTPAPAKASPPPPPPPADEGATTDFRPQAEGKSMVEVTEPAGALCEVTAAGAPVAKDAIPLSFAATSDQYYRITVHLPSGGLREVKVQARAGQVASVKFADTGKHGRQPLTPEQLHTLTKALDREAGDKAKLSVLETALRELWVTTDQAGKLLEHVVYRQSKLDAVPLIKGRILDRQNAYLLYQHFTYREDKELVRQMLEK
jgi:hypothetical protein